MTLSRCKSILTFFIVVVVFSTITNLSYMKEYKDSLDSYRKYTVELSGRNHMLELEVEYLKSFSLKLSEEYNKKVEEINEMESKLKKMRKRYEEPVKFNPKNDFQRDSILKVLYPDLTK